MRKTLPWLLMALVVAAGAWLLMGEELLGAGGRARGEGNATGAARGDLSVLLSTTGVANPATKAAEADPDGPSASAAAPGAANASGGQVLQGRVVDEGRHPVPGVPVMVQVGGDAAPLRTTSDGEGRFLVQAGAEADVSALRGMAMATTEDGRAAFAVFHRWLMPGEKARPEEPFTVPDLVLKKGQLLPIQVLAQRTPLSGAAVLVTPTDQWGLGGMIVSEGKTDAEGKWVAPVLPEGSYAVIAGGINAQQGRGVRQVKIPRPDPGEVLEVEVGLVRSLDVVVTDKETGKPIPNATILVGDSYSPTPPQGAGYLPALTIAPTNAEGRTTIHGLAADASVYVGADALGYPSRFGVYRTNVAHAEPRDLEVRLEMRQVRTLRFPIVLGKVAAPPDGTALEVRLSMWGAGDAADQIQAKVSQGDVVADGLPPQHVSGQFVTSGGLYADFNVNAQAEEGNNVVFQEGRTLAVRAVDSSGNPLPGTRLRAQSPRGPWGAPPAQLTDERGEVTFSFIPYRHVYVAWLPDPSQPWFFEVVARLDLEVLEGIQEIRLQERQTLVLRVTLGGTPSLPPQYTLSVDGRHVAKTDLEEAPDSGEIRARITLPPDRGPGPVTVDLFAKGFSRFHEKFERERLLSGDPIPVPLTAAGTILLRYTPPEGDDDVDVHVERWDEEREEWTSDHDDLDHVETDGEAGDEAHTLKFENLAPGRYRITESSTHLHTGTAEIHPGGDPIPLYLDLSVLTTIRGRVLAPEGTSLHGAQVRFARVEEPGEEESSGVSSKGDFEIPALRGDPVRLSLTHPILSPAAVGGTVVARGGQRGVVLRLERQTEVVFRVAGLATSGSGSTRQIVHTGDGSIVTVGGNKPTVTVSVFQGSLESSPIKVVRASFSSGLWRFGDLAPGIYHLALETARLAHVVLHNVQVHSGVTDLGTVVFPRGSSVRVSLEVPAGRARPRTWVSCRRLERPHYSRSAHVEAEGEGPIVVTGMGPGNWAVTVRESSPWAGGRREPFLEREIYVDGQAPVDLHVRIP